MKNIKQLFRLLCLVWIAFACDDYDRSAGGAVATTAPVLSLGQTSVQFSVPQDQIIPGSETDIFLFRINWNKARFSYENGLPADVNSLQYTLEMDLLGNLFANPLTVATTTEVLYTDVHSAQLKDWITELLGEEIKDTQYVEFRVRAGYQADKTETEPLYSNAVTLIVNPYTPPEPANDIMIKWKQVEGNWAEFAVYSWGGDPNVEAFGSWPGKLVRPNANGWYSVFVPKNRPIHLILNNNNGTQLNFLDDPTESGSYEVNTTLTPATFTKVDNPAEAITIRWKYAGSDWTAFAIYAYDGFPIGETFGGWPGKTVTPDAEGWCSVTVPAGQTVGNVIFNNAGGGGQFDVDLEIISDIYFEITSDAYTVVDGQ